MTFDYIVLIVLVAILSFLAIQKGKKPLIASLLAVYPAYLIYQSQSLITISDAIVGLAVFGVLLAASFIAVSKPLSTGYLGNGFSKYLKIVLLAASLVYILLFIITTEGLLGTLYTFSVSTLSTLYPFDAYVTLVIPMLVLAFAARE